MKKNVISLMFAGLLVLCAIRMANAALPEPPDPQVVANMSFDQRLQMSKDLREQFKKATPEERSAYRQKMHAKFKALSPDERKALHEKMRAQWQALTPEQKQQLKENRKAMVADLTPAEREEMKKHREQWKMNHPNAKSDWNAQMNN